VPGAHVSQMYWAKIWGSHVIFRQYTLGSSCMKKGTLHVCKYMYVYVYVFVYVFSHVLDVFVRVSLRECSKE
jgi:hypothetical protein